MMDVVLAHAVVIGVFSTFLKGSSKDGGDFHPA
jgi:hypothetical protein